MSDIWDARTRGKALALFTLAPFGGPALGPLVGGFIVTGGASWRWLFWTMTIFVNTDIVRLRMYPMLTMLSFQAGVCFAGIIFTLPETYT